MKLNVKYYTLDGSGSEIDNFNVNDEFLEYQISGTATSIGNYAISIIGTPQMGETFYVIYNGTLDITTNGNTFSILGVSITQAQLLKTWKAKCHYNGSSWNVILDMNFSETSVVSSDNIGTGTIVNANIANSTIDGSTKLVNLSVATDKINDLAITTGKIADLAVTDAKINNVDGSKIIASTVSNDKLDTMVDQTVKANISGGVANPSDVSITTLLNSNTWLVNGNSGLTAPTNFLGTTDAVDLVFKVNNTHAGKLSNSDVTANVSFGKNSLVAITSGTDNASFGHDALINNTSGIGNTAFGRAALSNTTSGNNNTSVGFTAGDTITNGASNVCIGYNSDVSNSNSSNRIAIGRDSLATADNQFALPDNVTTWKIRGNSFELPSADGSANAVLQTDGSGVLSFGSVVKSGVYTPTLTNGTNVAASTAYQCQYMRIGNVVTVSGKVDIDPTTTGATELGVSLIIPSTFANDYECAGTGNFTSVAGESVGILADTTNHRASFSYTAVDTGNKSLYFTFTYSII